MPAFVRAHFSRIGIRKGREKKTCSFLEAANEHITLERGVKKKDLDGTSQPIDTSVPCYFIEDAGYSGKKENSFW